MSFFRFILVAVVTFLAVGATSASAADWPLPAPVGYAQAGCGGCNVGYAPIVYATPVTPAPIVVGTGCGGCGGYAPTPAYSNWGCGGCGAPVAYSGCCGVTGPVAFGCGNCGIPAVYTPPAPIYVVNQGPEYVGPGVTVPFHTYAPPAQYAPPPAYPPYYSHRYYPRVAYGAHAYYHPHLYGPRLYGPRSYWRRPYWHG
jgi:hypothetical protein